MSNIIWLASYPKSGNTWLRAFIANYMLNQDVPVGINDLAKFGLSDGYISAYEKAAGRPFAELTPEDLNKLRRRVHQAFAESSPGTVLVKTHSALATVDDEPLITPAVTIGAVYIVRNPLDVAVSLRHHYGLSVDKAIYTLSSEATALPPAPNFMFQFLGSWKSHVESWTGTQGLRLHVARYEDMLAAPTPTFGAILDFLAVPRERPRLKKAVRFSSFKVLAGQEKKTGFIERPKHTERFFRKGKAGDWRQQLSSEQIDRIVADNGAVMRRFGYLSDDGEILV